MDTKLVQTWRRVTEGDRIETRIGTEPKGDGWMSIEDFQEEVYPEWAKREMARQKEAEAKSKTAAKVELEPSKAKAS